MGQCLMANPAQKTKDNFPAFKKLGAQMALKSVFVGVPADTSEQRQGEPINNATLAYIHQNGSPAKNIPARPFMTIGMAEAKEPATKQMENGAKKFFKSKDVNDIQQALGKAGFVAENAIKRAINSNIQPSLANATLAARKRRGRTGANTLVDTGALRNSIKYVIR